MHHPSVNQTNRLFAPQLNVSPRLLLGPGPSNAHPRVLQALSMRQVGHLDPEFLQIMNDNQVLLRYAWQTDNKFTIPVSGTGSAAMEATLANGVERGDVVLIGLNGYFGHRLVDMAQRYGAEVRTMMRPWGEVFTLDEIRAGLAEHRPKILALVHAETSTGACQPLEGVAELCHQYGTLLLVDSVTSLGGVPLFLDAWGVDMAYSGSQKCLSCPPGIAPLTFNERAMDKIMNRASQVPNWYLDMTMLGRYWGNERTYHHTAPINMNYGLREALRLVAEEGLAERWARHRATAELFWEGLASMGLSCHVAAEHRLPSLTTVRVPEGVDSKAVVVALRERYNIEIAGGLGELAGKVWRIGLMGFNSRAENVVLLLAALKEVLK
ncbi:MAG: alanine--glyoxylate aminotransferase family protein [Chloroflexi bacterium]|nr:alanine--glyoxylate aminotransferase family protein [Chloroflexota bacterium]